MSEDAVRRAWARGQLLTDRPSDRSLTDVVSSVVGVQAQDVQAAGLCVRARTHRLQIADLYRALEGRAVVLTWSMRGTRHIHLSSDLPWVLTLFGPVFGPPGRRAEQLGIAGAVGARAVRVLREALASEGPLTRVQVKERLAPHGVDPGGQAPVHIIRRAALEGVLCVVPTPDGKERYEPLEQLLSSPAVDPDEALVSLARRYLTAYGPASPADFSTWSGLAAAAAKQAWAGLSDELVELEGPTGTCWVLADAADALEGDGRRAAGLRLLGGFDTLLLGHADRTLLVPQEHAREVNAGGGMIKPVILAGNQVTGTWIPPTKRRPDPDLSLFGTLTRREQAELEDEVNDVRRFLGLA